MLKMSSFDINARPDSFVPLIHGVINDTSSQAMPNLRQVLHQFMDVMNLMSVANVSMHESMPKKYILAFYVTQEYI